MCWQQTCQGFEQGGFTSAIGAHNAGPTSFYKRHIDTAQNLLPQQRHMQLGGAQLGGKNETLGEEGDPPFSESLPGREPELGHMRSLVGLVWRTVVLWLVLLSLLSLARLLG